MLKVNGEVKKFKKSNISTFSGSSLLRLSSTIIAAVLSCLSEGTLPAGALRYFLASLTRTDLDFSLAFQY